MSQRSLISHMKKYNKFLKQKKDAINNMGMSHIFYEELPADDDNIFSANPTENNEIEEVVLRKDQNYMITGLSINQKIDSNAIIPDHDARNSLNDMITTYEKEKQVFYLTCKIYKEGVFKYENLFQKRSNILVTGYQYFDTTINKNKTIEFYKYFDHLENFSFR